MAEAAARQIESRLAACDPLLAANLESEGIEDALEAIGQAIRSRPRPATRSRGLSWAKRPRRLLLAVVALATIGGGAAAATTFLTAHTGQYAKGWQVEAGGPGEFLRTAAPDFCRVALRLSSDIPYPSGDAAWRRWVLIAEEGVTRVNPGGGCGSRTQGGRGEVSTGALHGFFAMSAFCAWIYDWRQAKLSHDSRASAQAAREIAAAPRWPAVVAEDPHPSSGPLRETRFGLTGSHSIFGWFLPFRAAVLSGDVAAVDKLIASNYGTAGCSYFNPPPKSDAGTVNPLASSS